MIAKTVFQTLDGKIHDSQDVAIKHLDKIYGDAICKLSVELLDITKYVKMQDFLGSNLGRFAELKKIQDDMVLIKEESD